MAIRIRFIAVKALFALAALAALPALLPAQGEKGVTTISSPGVGDGETAAANTRAVVVGISDYQDPGISDLRFAHQDARLFAEFLESRSGGQLPKEQIRLLTNEQATMAGIQAALEWLLNNTGNGDRAVIYFSCHGDVETRYDEEKGYLLTYDTPKNNYRLNAIDIRYLNEHIIGELSRHGAKVIVIMDACHSGTLAGEGIGGREATASELMKRFASEVKIMSCQPYELSLEGAKWGEGRGVFSYFLIDGLKGMADEDGDQRVGLFELEGFLQRRIREATNKTQHPDVFGGRKEEAIFNTDEATLETLRARGQAELTQNLENQVVYRMASPEGRANYLKFQEALEAGQLLEPETNSALHYYQALSADTVFIPLRGIMDERLTTALLDSAQQAIAAYLNADPEELAQRDRFDRRYARFAEYLRAAAEIFGPRDSRYRQTRAKQYYFEGLALRLAGEEAGGDDSLYRLALEKQQQALAEEDRAAYIHNELGLLQLELADPEAGTASLQQALRISPTWAIPFNNLATEYKRADSLDLAKAYYQKAIALKPDLASAFTNLGNLFSVLEMPDSAELMYRKALELSPANKSNYLYLGLLLSDQEGRQSEADSLYRQALELDPDYPEAYFELGNLYDALEQPGEAEAFYQKAIALNPGYADAFLNLGIHYYLHDRPDEAEKMFLEAVRADAGMLAAYTNLIVIYQKDWNKIALLLQNAQLETPVKMQILHDTGFAFLKSKALEEAISAFRMAIRLDPADPWSYYLLCTAYTLTGRERQALNYLNATLKKAGPAVADYEDLIHSDENLETLRQNKKYQRIMQRYFPEKQD